MGSQTIYHKSKERNFTINYPSNESNLSGQITPENNGEIFGIYLTNVATLSIGGANVPLPFVTPISLVGGTSYSVAITKITNGQIASVVLKSRRALIESTTINVQTILAESVQGTSSFFLHPSDNKMTVVDSSLINQSNYISDVNWTVNPKTVIDLPIITNVQWTSLFWDNVQDRMVIVGAPTNAAAIFYLTAYHLSGAKTGQIWNLQGTVQNTYSTPTTNNNQSQNTLIYPYVNYNDGTVSLISGRNYLSNLNDLLSWTFRTEEGFNVDSIGRKFNYRHSISRFTANNAFRKPNDTVFIENYSGFVGRSGFFYDNNANKIYMAYDSGGSSINIIQNSTVLGAINSTPTYNATLGVGSSVKRRAVFTKAVALSDHHRRITLLNLDLSTQIRNELVFTEANVTGCQDGDYLNSLELFCFLSNGTAATSGRRYVYFTSLNWDGVNPLLKYKLLLDYDSTFMATNRIRY